MSKVVKKKGRWPKIGTVRKGETGSYIKFNENVKILVDGEEVKMNDKRTANLVDPVNEVKSMIERKIIKEDQAESRLAKAEEASSWLRYEIVVPPPKDQ